MELDELRLLVLSSPKLVTSSDLDDSDAESEEEEIEKLCDLNGVDKDEGHGIKWYAPYGCRAHAGSVVVNGRKIAPCCRSRACLDCCQAGLRDFTRAIPSIRSTKKLYAIVITPPARIKHAEDVVQFFDNTRKMLRSWTRNYGLEYGYWVAECVPKFNEPRTEIPCPVRTKPLPDDIDDKYFPSAVEVMKDIQKKCHNGDSCPYCDGTGKLPAVHLHIHLIVSAPVFWYGKGPCTDEDKSWIESDFNGKGFYNFIKGYGFGVTKVQELKSPQGAARYLSKVFTAYLSKGSKVKKPDLKLVDGTYKPEYWDKKDTEDQGEIDWGMSQKCAMISSAIYGRKKHRGKVGAAYGIKTRVRDVAKMVVFSKENAEDVLQGGMATAAYQGKGKDYKELKRAAYLAREMERVDSGFEKVQCILDTMSVGLKRQKELGFYQYPEDTNNKVLIETQLDRDGNGGEACHREALASLGFLRENRGSIFKFFVERNYWGGSDRGYFGKITRRIDARESSLARRWDKAACIGEHEYWVCLMSTHFLFGRGESVFSLPLDCVARAGPFATEWIEDRVFESLLISLSESEWKDWVLWREYIVENGLFSDFDELSVVS